ncbi:hypothetical protein CVT24_009370 [Panaeolus cyanescens]|uniref:Xylanolytic transcriptional activator regulatory domain-containing protein n=1 Tax=Panaeolus cyanescens TaxID=181874 RepID=A0A409Y881_9AGAR|nr:hypothetical protein CVT24_009370 [Panaeolus cyanescens]
MEDIAVLLILTLKNISLFFLQTAGLRRYLSEGLMQPFYLKGRRDLKDKTHLLLTEVDELKARIHELETLLRDLNVNKERLPLELSREILDLVGAFPFGKKDHSYNLSIFVPYIPPKQTALYMTRLCYLKVEDNTRQSGISSDYFFSNFFDPIYDSLSVSQSLESIHPHKLAVFFAMLSTGGFTKVEDANILGIARVCESMSRAALSFLPLTSQSNICCATVQGLYFVLRLSLLENGDGGIPEEAWILLSIITRLIFQLQLRESNLLEKSGKPTLTFNLGDVLDLDNDTSMVERTEDDRDAARKIFWEIVICDSWSTLIFNRPPNFALDRINCPYPRSSVCSVSRNNSEGLDWKYRFAHCVSLIFLHVESHPYPPPYSTVLDGDRIIRTFFVPSYAAGVSGRDESFSWSSDADMALRQSTPLATVHLNLIFLHKIFLKEAILLNPDDPFSTPYRYSVDSVIRSASSILSIVASLYSKHSHLDNISWCKMSDTLLACNTLVDLVVQTPRSSIASPIMCILNSMVETYEKVAAELNSACLRQLVATVSPFRERALNAIAHDQLNEAEPRNAPCCGNSSGSSSYPAVNHWARVSDTPRDRGSEGVRPISEFSNWMNLVGEEWGWTPYNVENEGLRHHYEY